MTNLIIDIGNTVTKLAIFNNDDLTKQFTNENKIEQFVAELLTQNKIDNAIISTVKKDSLEDLKSIIKSKTKLLDFNNNISLPISIHYQSKQSLGLDRLAAVIGAQKIFQQKNILVIDAGTCVTYDFLNQNNEYLGGSIAPGIVIKLQALHQYTAKLPLVSSENLSQIDLCGTNTINAIRSGVVLGTVNEIKGFIEQYQYRYPDLKIILSGGSGHILEPYLKKTIFANILSFEPNLVLNGLNEVIAYNYAS